MSEMTAERLAFLKGVAFSTHLNIDICKKSHSFDQAAKMAVELAELKEAVDEIDRLRAENDGLEVRIAELKDALREIAYNTSTSVPLGHGPTYHHTENLDHCIGIAANALAGAKYP